MSTIRERFDERFSGTSRLERVLGGHMVRRGFRMGVSAVAFLVLWQLVASLFFEPFVLPTPAFVGETLLEILEIGGPRGEPAWYHVRQSLVRVIMATTVGMSLAIILGIVMGLHEGFEAALGAWLPFWMTVPTIVVVLVTMVMFRYSETSVAVAVVFAATPYATVNMWKGVENIDASLIEMANAFGVGNVDVLRHIYLPSLLPSIFGSLRYLVSIVWKIVVLAEVFGMDNGLGAMFRFWYSHARIEIVLAYLILFVVVMFAIEYGLLYPIERYLFRWRDSS